MHCVNPLVVSKCLEFVGGELALEAADRLIRSERELTDHELIVPVARTLPRLPLLLNLVQGGFEVLPDPLQELVEENPFIFGLCSSVHFYGVFVHQVLGLIRWHVHQLREHEHLEEKELRLVQVRERHPGPARPRGVGHVGLHHEARVVVRLGRLGARHLGLFLHVDSLEIELQLGVNHNLLTILVISAA